MNESQRYLSGVGSLDALFLSKWQALLQLERAPNAPETFARLASVVEMARAKSHYETVRDLTLKRVVHAKDPTLANLLVKGTPYAAFFQRPDGMLVLDLGKATTKSSLNFARGPITESFSTSIESPEPPLPGGGLERRMVGALLSDFYKPFSIQRLWQETAPGQFFNPVSSPNLVHQKLHRTRDWLDRHETGLNILCLGNRYEIEFERAVTLSLPLKTAAPRVDKLIEFMGTRAHWSLSELQVDVKWPRRTLQRCLNDAVAGELIARSGRGRATTYSTVQKKVSD